MMRASVPCTVASRGGFAMLTVLWAVVVIGTLTIATALTGRNAFNAGRNRVNAARAFWLANDCAERARASIDSALNRSDMTPSRTWRHLDAVVLSDPLSTGSSCQVVLEATGTRLDVNAAAAADFTRLFTAMGRSDADALADAIVDWRDADDDPLPNGAESQWYAGQRRTLPRNAPIADNDELAKIRGFEDGSAQHFLSVESGLISFPNAFGPVLAAVPGMTDEAVAAVMSVRAQGGEIDDLIAFASTLSSAARDSITCHYQEISRVTTLDPEAWIVTAAGRSGLPAVAATVELRLVRTNRRAPVVRRRVRA
jgi:type II secretory pathway component PulK